MSKQQIFAYVLYINMLFIPITIKTTVLFYYKMFKIGTMSQRKMEKNRKMVPILLHFVLKKQ